MCKISQHPQAIESYPSEFTAIEANEVVLLNYGFLYMDQVTLRQLNHLFSEKLLLAIKYT